MKVCLITGAGSGIGRATALAFASAGVCVVGVGRDREKLESLEQEAAGKAGRLATLAIDVTLDEAPARCRLACRLAVRQAGLPRQQCGHRFARSPCTRPTTPCST